MPHPSRKRLIMLSLIEPGHLALSSHGACSGRVLVIGFDEARLVGIGKV